MSNENFLAAVVAGSLAAPVPAFANDPALIRVQAVADAAKPADARQKILDILTGNPSVARAARAMCAQADQPSPGEVCVAAMVRQAKDGDGFALYNQLVHDRAVISPLSNEELRIAAALPVQIAEAIAAGKVDVSIGRDRFVSITPGLALDAGFTNAWYNKGAGAATVSDEARFKASTELCTTQKADNKRCFTIGYVHGARAASLATNELSATTAQTQRVVTSAAKEIFEQKIFDHYLRFSSKEEERAYRERETARREAVSLLVKTGTSHDALAAAEILHDQLRDIGKYGTGPEFDAQKTLPMQGLPPLPARSR